MPKEPGQLALTLSMAKVLRAFLEDPHQPRYGFELIKQTDIKSGTMYPMLVRLEKYGYLRSWREEIDTSEAGRPGRVMYRLTPLGRREASVQLEELNSLIAPRPKKPTVSEPGGILRGA